MLSYLLVNTDSHSQGVKMLCKSLILQLYLYRHITALVWSPIENNRGEGRSMSYSTDPVGKLGPSSVDNYHNWETFALPETVTSENLLIQLVDLLLDNYCFISYLILFPFVFALWSDLNICLVWTDYWCIESSILFEMQQKLRLLDWKPGTKKCLVSQ